jgi:hypothetical protein
MTSQGSQYRKSGAFGDFPLRTEAPLQPSAGRLTPARLAYFVDRQCLEIVRGRKEPRAVTTDIGLADCGVAVFGLIDLARR